MDIEAAGAVMDELLPFYLDRASVGEVLAFTLERCAEIEPSPVWDVLRDLDLAADLAGSETWLSSVLAEEPPPSEIDGLWFGLYNPVEADGEASSDLYVSGGSSFPADDWPCDPDWWAEGRYRESGVLRTVFQETDAAGESAAMLGDYLVTFALAAATVVHLTAAVPTELLLGGAPARGVVVGHDSGDRLYLGTVTAAGFDMTGLGWGDGPAN